MKIATSNMKVKVKVDIEEVLQVNQVEETFTAVFSVQMFWIDPLLANFPSRVTFRPEGEPGGSGWGEGQKREEGAPEAEDVAALQAVAVLVGQVHVLHHPGRVEQHRGPAGGRGAP